MISLEEIKNISRKLKIDEGVVAREYIQILFLNELYSQSFSKYIFFKGGTAIRLIYKGTRFSEDLDFTVNINESEFEESMHKFLSTLSNKYLIKSKEKKSVSGKSFLLTATIPGFKTDIFIRLDFSFRENVLEPQSKVLLSDYPLLINSFVQVLSIDEIIAEKIRAIMTRDKARDIYDIWVLLQLGGKLNIELINKKLDFYKEKFDKDLLISRVRNVEKESFVKDLQAFIPINERGKLPDLLDFIKAFISEKVS
ncbi:MAG: nucleotidyl transferase AbiEii/AbiGii toxin family protein [bacterium]